MPGFWNRRGPRVTAFAVLCALALPSFAATPAPTAATSATPAATSATPAATSAGPSLAQDAAVAKQHTLNAETQDIKKQALELNRDLFSLEQKLLFPANTQVAVFVSMDTGNLFSLDSVQVKIDNKIVANYLYTPKQINALHRGGVQRLYVGNVTGGKHQIVAVFTGHGPHGRDYRRGATYTFTKDDQPEMLELKIVDATADYQPQFQIKEWQ